MIIRLNDCVQRTGAAIFLHKPINIFFGYGLLGTNKPMLLYFILYNFNRTNKKIKIVMHFHCFVSKCAFKRWKYNIKKRLP